MGNLDRLESLVVILGVALAVAAGAGAQVLPWAPVVGGGATTAAGFGDANNTEALSAVSFGGNLYIGTYNEQPISEIWRSSNGTSWTLISGTGYGAALDYGAYSMGVIDSALHVGTWGGFSAAADTRIWRFGSGDIWYQVNTDGFGDNDNSEPWAMENFGGYLYVGTANYPDGGEIHRSPSGFAWSQANVDGFGDGNNSAISALEAFGLQLYAATLNETTGVEIWHSSNGTSWAQSNVDGFGAAANIGAFAMAVFGNAIYASTFNSAGLEVWRLSADGLPIWTRVVSGGFGDAGNWGSHAMVVHQGALYLGTRRNDWAGAEVWRTQDGAHWSQVSAAGFGSGSNLAVMNLTEHDGALYAGLWNPSGCQVWRVVGPFFADGFESGGTQVWSTTSP